MKDQKWKTSKKYIVVRHIIAIDLLIFVLTLIAIVVVAKSADQQPTYIDDLLKFGGFVIGSVSTIGCAYIGIHFGTEAIVSKYFQPEIWAQSHDQTAVEVKANSFQYNQYKEDQHLK